jgi:hypothetical protein
MKDHRIIVYQGERVLTTPQLADDFGTDQQILVNNYNRNKDRYKSRKHFILLEGEDLRDFRAKNQIDLMPNINKLYLWPKKGAWLHAKSLNTDTAWDAYEALVDDYYEKLEQPNALPDSVEDLIIMQAQSMKDVKAKVIELEGKVQESNESMNEIKRILLLPTKDWRKTINDMLNEAAIKLGGGGKFQELKSDSYMILTDRAACRLNVSLTNLKNRLEEAGATKTQIKNASKLDVIENDKRLKEIYTTIVKELSIGTL